MTFKDHLWQLVWRWHRLGRRHRRKGLNDVPGVVLVADWECVASLRPSARTCTQLLPLQLRRRRRRRPSGLLLTAAR